MTSFRAVRLGDLGHMLTIARGFPTKRAVTDGGVRVMSVAALRNQIPPKFFARRDDIADAGLDTGRPGDVLIAIEGGTVGESMVVPADIDEFVPSQQVATLRAAETLFQDSSTAALDPYYLGAWLSTEPAREQIRRLARGSGIQRIPVADLANLTIMVPSIQEQQAIGRRFMAFDDALHQHQTTAACLQELRDVDLVVTFADAYASEPR